MLSKYKYIKNEDSITVNFPRRMGGAKTLTSDAPNYKTLMTLIEGGHPFNDVFAIFNKQVEILKTGKRVDIIKMIRGVVNHKIKTDPEFVLKFQSLSSVYQSNYEVEYKRIKELILGDLYHVLNGTKQPDDVVETLPMEQYIFDFFDRSKMINNYFKGTELKVVGGQLYYKDEILVETMLVKHVISCAINGVKTNSYTKFLENIMENPRKDIREELFTFLSNGNFPIHDDGTFSAYKKVRRDNWNDIYSNSVRHMPGDSPRMSWNDIDTNRHSHCSKGFHFCAWGYLGSFGGKDDRIVEVRINPKDVGSIPADCNNTKGRCIGYDVIREIIEEKELDLLTFLY